MPGVALLRDFCRKSGSWARQKAFHRCQGVRSRSTAGPVRCTGWPREKSRVVILILLNMPHGNIVKQTLTGPMPLLQYDKSQRCYTSQTTTGRHPDSTLGIQRSRAGAMKAISLSTRTSHETWMSFAQTVSRTTSTRSVRLPTDTCPSTASVVTHFKRKRVARKTTQMITKNPYPIISVPSASKTNGTMPFAGVLQDRRGSNEDTGLVFSFCVDAV